MEPYLHFACAVSWLVLGLLVVETRGAFKDNISVQVTFWNTAFLYTVTDGTGSIVPSECCIDLSQAGVVDVHGSWYRGEAG
jgi:hypothetical protein